MSLISNGQGPPTVTPSNMGPLNAWNKHPAPPNATAPMPAGQPLSMAGGLLTGVLAGPSTMGKQYLPKPVGS